MVLAEGQECQGLYVVLEGQVIKSMSDAHGKKKNLGYANPGDLLGRHFCHSQGRKLSPSLLQIETARLPYLIRFFMRRVLKDNPEFSQKMEQDIEIRLKTINAIREQNPLNPNSLGDDKEQDMTLKDLLRKWQNEPRND